MKFISGRRTLAGLMLFMAVIAIVAVSAVSYEITHLSDPVLDLRMSVVNPKVYYCPGDSLYVNFDLTTTRRNVITLVVDSWWSVNQEETVINSTSPLYALYPFPTVVHRERAVVIPQLPAGQYEYRKGIQVIDDGTQVVTTPITIGVCK